MPSKQATEAANAIAAHEHRWYVMDKLAIAEIIDRHFAASDLAIRAVRGLKHVGSFRRTCGEDPHPLDCSLAGRVSYVFGLGRTRSIELCRQAGEDSD